MNARHIKPSLILWVFVLVGIVGIIVLGIISLHLGWTIFDTPGFLNASFDFILGIVSFMIAFTVGQVLWDAQLKKERSTILKQTVLIYLYKFYQLADQSLELLKPIDAKNVADRGDIDLVIKTNIDEIEKLDDLFASIFGQVALIEDTNIIKVYLNDIQPEITKLFPYKQNKPIRGNVPEIKNLLAELKDKTNGIIQELVKNGRNK
jgi:hypothetical protein